MSRLCLLLFVPSYFGLLPIQGLFLVAWQLLTSEQILRYCIDLHRHSTWVSLTEEPASSWIMPSKNGLTVELQHPDGTRIVEHATDDNVAQHVHVERLIAARTGSRFQICVAVENDFRWYTAECLCVEVVCGHDQYAAIALSDTLQTGEILSKNQKTKVTLTQTSVSLPGQWPSALQMPKPTSDTRKHIPPIHLVCSDSCRTFAFPERPALLPKWHVCKTGLDRCLCASRSHEGRRQRATLPAYRASCAGCLCLLLPQYE